MLFRPAQFDMAGQREILAERMAFKAIVRQDAAHVRIAGEHHAVTIPGLALIPAGVGIKRGQRRHRRAAIGGKLHAQPQIVRHRQQVDHDLEAFSPVRIIGATYVGELVELEVSRIAQRRDRRHQRLALHHRRGLAGMFNHVDQGTAQQLAQPRAERIMGGHHRPAVPAQFRSNNCHVAYRSNTPTRRIFRCRARMP